MQWLIRKQGNKVKAHIWNGEDTRCRMWSTGGLKQSRFEVRTERGNHEVCHMCMRALEQETIESIKTDTLIGEGFSAERFMEYARKLAERKSC